MKSLLQDLRQGVRSLRQTPGFTAVVVTTLALGIGANTAIFSVVRAVLLRPLPFPRADRLVVVEQLDRSGGRETVSPGDLLDVADQTRDVLQLAAWRQRDLTLSMTGNPERVAAAVVTPNFFSLLGIPPFLGRGFLRDAGHGGSRTREIVLSQAFWARRFGSRPDVLGMTVLLEGEPATIVGVQPSNATFPVETDLWASPRNGYAVPEHPLQPATDPASMRGSHYLDALGRIRDGIPKNRVLAGLDLAFDRVARAHPDSDLTGTRPALEELREHEVKDSRASLCALLGSVVLVLLIACANVANLLLSRGTARANELAIRAALGAGRPALVRLLLAETAVLVLAAAVLGVGLAGLGTGALAVLLARGIVAAGSIRIDGAVLAFTLALSGAAGLSSGLWPALRASRRDPQKALRRGGRTFSGANRRTHGALVLAESALSLLLVVGAGLLLRSLSRLHAQDEGFRTDRVLTLAISLPPARYSEPAARTRFADLVLERLRPLPGVRSAALVSRLPLGSGNSTRSFAIEGRIYPPSQDSEAQDPDYLVASPGYFETLGIPVLAGRAFTDRDTESSPAVAVVSRTMARAHWPGQSPVGKRLKIGAASDPVPWITIIGVVGDVRQHDLA
ncbi:MAG: ADOP family duplicated permease, partial [Thermoanaerobaculia bacterium]